MVRGTVKGGGAVFGRTGAVDGSVRSGGQGTSNYELQLGRRLGPARRRRCGAPLATLQEATDLTLHEVPYAEYEARAFCVKSARRLG